MPSYCELAALAPASPGSISKLRGRPPGIVSRQIDELDILSGRVICRPPPPVRSPPLFLTDKGSVLLSACLTRIHDLQ